ncbi:MAG: hypothetical protein ACRECZ_01930 [Methylocella sp.]
MKSGAQSARNEYGNEKKNRHQISKARKEVHGRSRVLVWKIVFCHIAKVRAAASADFNAAKERLASRASLALNGTAD